MTRRLETLKVVVLGLCGLGLTACASGTPRNAPAWYQEAVRNEQPGYPDLRDVPTTTSITTDANHWAEVQADVLAARQAMASNPRSEPAPPAQNADTFVEDARAAIEATRAAHPGN